MQLKIDNSTKLQPYIHKMENTQIRLKVFYLLSKKVTKEVKQRVFFYYLFLGLRLQIFDIIIYRWKE